MQSLWGRPPGLRGTPSSRGRSNDIRILQSTSRPTGAPVAVRGDCPTIDAGAWWCENYVAPGTPARTPAAGGVRPSPCSDFPRVGEVCLMGGCFQRLPGIRIVPFPHTGVAAGHHRRGASPCYTSGLSWHRKESIDTAHEAYFAIPPLLGGSLRPKVHDRTGRRGGSRNKNSPPPGPPPPPPRGGGGKGFWLAPATLFLPPFPPGGPLPR